jgi:hypothetical protein
MKKAIGFLGIAALCLAAFGLVLAGCDSSGDTEDPAEAAAQLAKDLNAIKEGIADVDGVNVTLTGQVINISSPLTVPAGVTLDVTANNAALGLRDATLTVNGTVIAAPNAIRLEDNAEWGTIDGNGTIRLKGKGSLLQVQGNSRKITLDSVTLAGVIDNNASLVSVRSGGTFVMKSGKITNNTFTSDSDPAYGGGVVVRNGGTFIMEDGEISGNAAQSNGVEAVGGGVYVGLGNESTTFTMSGGTISHNTVIGNSSSHGGGVFVRMAIATFAMEGGTISDNTAIGTNDYSSGGGVEVIDGATFIMEGGIISGNTANNKNSGGGGVKVNKDALFTFKGGTIYGRSDKLPAGTDLRLANYAKGGVSLDVYKGTAKWGTGGTYKGGESQTAGGDILHVDPDNGGGTDDTLIATPAK